MSPSKALTLSELKYPHLAFEPGFLIKISYNDSSYAKGFCIVYFWPSWYSVHQWSGRPGFNPWSGHPKDFKNDT